MSADEEDEGDDEEDATKKTGTSAKENGGRRELVPAPGRVQDETRARTGIQQVSQSLPLSSGWN